LFSCVDECSNIILFSFSDDDFSSDTKEAQPEYSWRWFVDKMLMKLSDDQRAAMMDATNKSKTSKRIVAPKVSSASQSVASNAPIGEEVAETSIKRHNKKKDSENNSYRRGGGRKVGIEAFSAIPEEELASEHEIQTSGGPSGVASVEVSARMSVSDEVLQMKKDAAAIESASVALGAGQRYVPNKSLPSSKGEANRKVTNQSSLKTLMSTLFAVLLTGMVITMIVVVTHIQIQGVMWTDHVKDDLRVKITANLQSIVQAKAKYVEVCVLCDSATHCLMLFLLSDFLQPNLLGPHHQLSLHGRGLERQLHPRRLVQRYLRSAVSAESLGGPVQHLFRGIGQRGHQQLLRFLCVGKIASVVEVTD
jgi:hypothetical protein